MNRMTPEPIPFLDLVSPHRELEEELVAAFRTAVRNAHFIGGTEVEAFEQEFATYCGASHCVGVASGTDALRFALIAAGVGSGDAVITVAHTFIATTEAISQSGASTEFVDIDLDTYTMSVAGLDEYLSHCDLDAKTGKPLGRRTGQPIKAIVPVHLYGQVADMDGLCAVADRYGLLVIEDACQAHGAEYRTRSHGDEAQAGRSVRAGAIGRAAAFSFYPGKNLGACGEAGAVTTNDPDIARTVRMLRDHGQSRKYYHDLEGYNGRLDAIQAAFLRIKLRRLDAWNESRRAAAARYNDALADVPDIVIPHEPDYSRGVYHLYVIRHPDREALANHLRSAGVSTAYHYPVPVHLQNCYQQWGYRTGSLPATEQAASEILSLPMFPGLTAAAQDRVTAAVSEALALGRNALAT